MINADLIKTDYTTYPVGPGQTITIKELPYFTEEPYDIMNPKEAVKYVKDLESVIRTSFEYRHLIAYLRETEDMNECTFLRNVTNLDNTKVRIELHHTPFTLFDIVNTVVLKRLKRNESTDIFDVAKEVMWLHYAGWVGLVPVCETVHQMIHNQYLFVPTHVIRGDYEAFMDAYTEYIEPELMQAVEKGEQLTLSFFEDHDPENIITRQMEIFNIHPTQIRIENLIPRKEAIEGAKAVVRNRINQIKSGKQLLYRVLKPKNKENV